jgi:hydrogenase nickel incorporation protein HypA/HybF
MHELALMENVVDAVCDQIGDEQVVLVQLEIGELAGVELEALRYCFDACVAGTQLEGAELAIRSVPGRARCYGCGAAHPLRSFTASCACGSFDREVLSGTELRVKEVEVQ